MKRIFRTVLWMIPLIALVGSVCVMLQADTLRWVKLVMFWFMIVLLLLPLGWAFISQYATCSVSQSLWIRLIPVVLTVAFWIIELNFHIYTLLLNVLGEFFSFGILEYLLCPIMLLIHGVTWVWYEHKKKHSEL